MRPRSRIYYIVQRLPKLVASGVLIYVDDAARRVPNMGWRWTGDRGGGREATPFNLHAKRPIEHIVILIGPGRLPRSGQWRFDYTHSLAISGHRVARARKIYFRPLASSSPSSPVACCCFIARSNISSFSFYTVSISPLLLFSRAPALLVSSRCVRSIPVRQSSRRDGRYMRIYIHICTYVHDVFCSGSILNRY